MSDAGLPGSLASNPGLGQWISFSTPGVVTVFSGKVELGQGISTALAQVVADELDVDLDQVRMAPVATDESPNEMFTAGSLSIVQSGTALRHACAELRAVALSYAADDLEARADELVVDAGVILAPNGRTASYWTLPASILEREATGELAPKAPAARRLIGTHVDRIDLPSKVDGSYRFIHDLVLPGMAHGRVLCPPSQGARLRKVAVDEVRGHAGVLACVRQENFVGVVAATAADADGALSALETSARWEVEADLPDQDDLATFLRSAPAETTVVHDHSSEAGRAIRTVRTVRAGFTRPYVAHASIAPSCAVAVWEGSAVRVWSHTQGPFPLRRALAAALAVDEHDVHVDHVPSAGTYGHNGADDAAYDAVRLAAAVSGTPVRVQWSRRDDLASAPFGPAMAVEIEASVDDDNRVVAWRHEVWSNGHAGRPGDATEDSFLGARHHAGLTRGAPSKAVPAALGFGAERNAIPYYDLPAIHVISHRLLEMPLRTSSLRALGGFLNVVAIEAVVDEVAGLVGADPVEQRLEMLGDPRAREVVERAASAAGWGRRGPTDPGTTAQGMGFARYKNSAAYCAVVADVEVDREVRVTRLTIAVDAGMVVSPDGVVNQIEGGAIQATSWTLLEAVRFDHTSVTSVDWDSYPILRFSQVPEVQVHVLDRPDEPPLGTGEAAAGPTGAAIANGVAAALGIRVHDLPFTRERLVVLLS